MKDYLSPHNFQNSNETIEMWNNEPHNIDDNALPIYFWNLEFKGRSRKLIKPIIYPANCKWRVLWKINSNTIKQAQIRHFGTEIHFENFLIIENLVLKI